MENFIDNKIQKDLKIAEENERLLFDLLIRDGYVCEKPNKYQNIYEHWDVATTINGTFSRIDVKGKSKFDENDNICLELKNVHGDIGWLRAPLLHTIAFEREDCFIFIKRLELLELVEKKIAQEDEICGEIRIYDDKKDLTRPYQRYTRMKFSTEDRPRKDLMVYAPLTDFEHLTYKTVYK